jgi:phage protein D
MFKYVSINFPNTSVGPKRVYEMTFYQNRYEHEVVVMHFRDWDVPYEAVEAGSPVHFNISNVGESRDFYGYIDHINVNKTPGTFTTQVVAVGASYVMKNQSQSVYKNLSADAIIKQIAVKHNFVAITAPHPRVYPQVSQTGHTDWELCVRLAKQSGYSLRTENTELYFQPMLHDYTEKRAQAVVLTMRDAQHPSGSDLYKFFPLVGEHLEHDGDQKAAIAVSGMDSGTKTPISHTKQTRNNPTRRKVASEFFDKFHTHVVADNPATAAYEAEAAENRTMFPYRATAEARGRISLRPDMPVYLVGVGGHYEGYWTILGTEHRIIEEQRNSQTYTTILHLGTDSLGQATKWTDGKVVSAPNGKQSRTIIPGVRQVNVPNKTVLHKPTINLGPQNTGQFTQATNRAPAVGKNQKVTAPSWKTGTPAGSTQAASSVKTTATRLLKRIPKVT